MPTVDDLQGRDQRRAIAAPGGGPRAPLPPSHPQLSSGTSKYSFFFATSGRPPSALPRTIDSTR